MKLLLTSAGITNKSIAKAVLDLSGLKASEIKLAFIPTAANVVEGDKDWLIDDLWNFKQQGYESIDIVDIASVPEEIWKPRLEAANVFCFGGGDEQYLAKIIKESGLEKILPDLLKNRLYIGISAGSMVAGQFLILKLLEIVYPGGNFEGKLFSSLKYVDCHFIPHFNSDSFPHIRKEKLEKIKDELSFPLYALDDQSALKIINKNIEIVSEGRYLKI